MSLFTPAYVRNFPLHRLEAEKEKEKKKKRVLNDEGLQIALPEYVSSSIAGIGSAQKRATAEGGGEEEGVGNVRWLRVNTIKWSVEECVEWFENERWELVEDVETLLEVSFVSSFSLTVRRRR